MKSLLPLFMLFLMNSTSFAQDKQIETIAIKTTIFCDHCIQCGSCGPRINDAIRTNKGIQKVTINTKQNIINVRYDAAKTTPQKIREAIAAVGFDADELKASPSAYYKLDGCCKAK